MIQPAQPPRGLLRIGSRWRHKTRSSLAALLLVGASLSAWTLAQEADTAADVSPDSPSAGGAGGATDEPTTEIQDPGLGSRPGSLPPDAFRNNPDVGVPYRELFRNTRSPFNPTLRTPDANVTLRSETESVRLNFRTALPDFRGNNNLLGRGFAPEKADLKIGPFYFKLNALTAAVLASDNATQTQEPEQSGAIAIAQLSATVMAQFTENLRLAATGNLIWLPMEGRVGVSAAGIFDQFSIDQIDFGRAQLTWDTTAGDWRLFFADTFRLFRDNSSYQGVEDFVLFEGEAFEEIDRIGRYSFGGRGQRLNSDNDRRDLDFGDVALDSVGYSNEILGVAERLLPGPARLRISVYHEDLWYNQGNRGQPALREGASVSLRSERPNLRFNPYLVYQAGRSDEDDDFAQQITGGFQGPITDQLLLNVYAGYFLGTNRSEGRIVGGLGLTHIAGPFTTENLFIGREIDEYEDEAFDNIRYGIRHIFSRRLQASAYAGYGVSTDLRADESTRTELRLGFRLQAELGPRSSARLTYGFRHSEANNAGFLFDETNSDRRDVSYDIHTVRLELGYRFTETFRAHLLYQFQDRASEIDGDSYKENLVLLTLTKYFE